MAQVLSCDAVVALIVDEIARVNAVVVEGISQHDTANPSVLMLWVDDISSRDVLRCLIVGIVLTDHVSQMTGLIGMAARFDLFN